ncbi:major facilitator superfamily domain-containing protein [Xylariales sp. PMI_506]|nr:major facilitator superfamily domain-containing protein [Xylariales sp. PMI_506]
MRYSDEFSPPSTDDCSWLSVNTVPGTPASSPESEDTLAEEWEHLPKWRRPSVFWLLPPALLLTVAFGGVMVPKINLTVGLICRGYFEEQARLHPDFTPAPVLLGGENPQCQIPEVQQKVATFRLLIGMLMGGLSAFVVPKIGSLSDRYGRTRVLVIVSIGGIINEAIAILTAQFPDTVHYNWLLLGAFFDGLTGSFTAASVLANSYTSDCTPPAKRGVHTGFLYACISMGWAFGPLLAGYFVKVMGSIVSLFYVTLCCHIVFMLFIWWITPESVSVKSQMFARVKYEADRAASAQLKASKVSRQGGSRDGHHRPSFLRYEAFVSILSLFDSLKILAPSGLISAPVRRNLILLAVIDTVMMGVYMNSDSITILYLEAVFDWGTFESSQWVSVVSFAEVILLLTVIPVVDYFFRRQHPQSSHDAKLGDRDSETNSGADEVDLRLLTTALLLESIGALGYVVSRTPGLFYLFGIIASFEGLRGAVMKSILTKHVPPERVGSLLGALGLLQSVGMIVVPVLFNGVYAATVHTYPQAFFILLSVVNGSMALTSLFVKPHLFLKDEVYELVPQVAL